MALVATVGSANANSYVTRDEFDVYVETRTPALGTFTDEEVDAALIQATRLLDAAFLWTGLAVDETQALGHPRSGLFTRNGFAVSTTALGADLKKATSEFACQLLNDDRLGDDDIRRQGITKIKAGSVELGFAKSESSTLALRDADLRERGPEFAYLSSAIPDVVRLMIPPSWYERGSLAGTFMFEADR